MFDLTSSKMLLLAVIALLVVGPKDLPHLLRTVGRYIGMIKRQAAEFRSQFDEAMKESELSELKKQVEDFSREAETAVKDAEATLNKEVAAVEAEAHKTLADLDAAANQGLEGRADLTQLPPPDEAVPVSHAETVSEPPASTGLPEIQETGPPPAAKETPAKAPVSPERAGV